MNKCEIDLNRSTMNCKYLSHGLKEVTIFFFFFYINISHNILEYKMVLTFFFFFGYKIGFLL